MKKIIVFCLFFTLISASVCFAQDWGDTGYSDFNDEDPYVNSDPGYFDDVADNPADSAGSVATSHDSAATDSSAATAAAEAAAASAAAAANSAETAATAAAESAASAAAAAESVTAASATPPPPPQPAQSSLPPQPPVRIVIPMITTSPVQIVPPAQPPVQPAPPAVQYAPPVQSAPPVQYAPPVNRQPSINVIPAMPNPHSNGLYRVQVGAFSSSGLAQQCFSRLRSAGFTPAYEPYGNVNRVVLTGIRAADMATVVQRLAAAGFNEVWIREEK